jgi:hypothetical protein
VRLGRPLTIIAPTTRSTFSATVDDEDFQAQDLLVLRLARRGRVGNLTFRCCAEDHGATFGQRENCRWHRVLGAIDEKHRRFDLILLTLRRSLFALSFGKLEEPYSSTLVSRQANFQRPVHANTTIARRGSAKRRRFHNFLVSAEGQLPLSCSPVARVEIEQSADLKLRMGDRIED